MKKFKISIKEMDKGKVKWTAEFDIGAETPQEAVEHVLETIVNQENE